MSVKVSYKGAEIASVSTDATKVLKTSGKYCEDDISIINTQDGSSGGFFHESGEISYHTGGKLRTITIPVSDDSYDYYIVRAKATASWLLVGGEWVEQTGIDFTGAVNADNAVCNLVMFTNGIGQVPMTTTSGASGSLVEIYAISRRSPQSVASANYVGYNNTPTIAQGEIRLSLGSGNNLCSETWGLTYEYEVWGFNN